MIMTAAQILLKLGDKGFTKKEAITSDAVWMICFTAVGLYFWVI
jgi:hypothetical protein